MKIREIRRRAIMVLKDWQERNWKPIIKEFETIVGKNGVVQRREELITYECDGLTSYRQLQNK
jgi:glycolate oxidase